MLAHLRSFHHEPALTRFTACYAGCSFSNGTRKTNAAFGVACFSLVLIILQHFTSFVHCFPTRGTFYEKESCKAGFSACGGSRKRHSSIPLQCDPRGAFYPYRNKVSYTIKKQAGPLFQNVLPAVPSECFLPALNRPCRFFEPCRLFFVQIRRHLFAHLCVITV